jgi:hypothetical protein
MRKLRIMSTAKIDIEHWKETDDKKYLAVKNPVMLLRQKFLCTKFFASTGVQSGALAELCTFTGFFTARISLCSCDGFEIKSVLSRIDCAQRNLRKS